MISRREPLLWLQLMALAVIPLELELMRLILAGPAYGPVPALERLLIWGLAVVAPGVLLWRRSADWASLLLVRIAPAKRSLDQCRISAIQQPLGLKAALIIGIALLLPLFWWVDQSALLVVNFSPTQNSSRLTALLLAGPLLTLILWQWQQLFQAIWLLTRSDQSFTDLTPIIPAELQTTHLSLGLGLLQPPLLEWEAAEKRGQPSKASPRDESEDELKPSAPDPAPDPQTDPAETDADEVLVEDLPETNNEDQEVISADDQDADDAVASIDVEAFDVEQELLKEPDDDNQNGEGAADSDVAGSNAETDQQSTQQPALDSEPNFQPESAETAANSDLPEQSSEKSKISSAENDDEIASAVAPIAIEPEQSPEEDHSPDLNGQVSPDITGASTDAEAHHEEAETSGSEQGDPEQPSQPTPGGA